MAVVAGSWDMFAVVAMVEGRNCGGRVIENVQY